MQVDPRESYPSLLMAALLMWFWSGLAVFLYLREIVPIPPLYFVVGIAVAALPLLFYPGTVSRVLRVPLLWWGVAYLAFSALSVLISSQNNRALPEFSTRLLSVGTMWIVLLVASRSSARATAGRMLPILGLIAVGLVGYDLIEPLTFSAVIGRGAGFWINPNTASTALLTALLTAAWYLTRWRTAVVVVLALGVIATLSRGGIIILSLLLIILVVQRKIKLLPLAITLGLGLLVAYFTGYLDQAIQTIGDSPLVNERLRGFVGASGGLVTGSLDDLSVSERLRAVQAAWTLFRDHPFFGAGIGATTDWGLSLSTHNIYLRHLAEHGMSGAWIYPTFVGAVVAGARRGTRLPVGLMLLVLGLADHNVLDAWPLLVWTAWVAGGRFVPANGSMSNTPRAQTTP